MANWGNKILVFFRSLAHAPTLIRLSGLKKKKRKIHEVRQAMRGVEEKGKSIDMIKMYFICV